MAKLTISVCRKVAIPNSYGSSHGASVELETDIEADLYRRDSAAFQAVAEAVCEQLSIALNNELARQAAENLEQAEPTAPAQPAPSTNGHAPAPQLPPPQQQPTAPPARQPQRQAADALRGPSGRPIKSAKALFAETMGCQQDGAKGLVDYLSKWGMDRGFPANLVEYSADQVAQAVPELCACWEDYQRRQNQPAQQSPSRPSAPRSRPSDQSRAYARG